MQDGLRTNYCTVVISNSSFENNGDDGINAYTGELQIDNCQFNNNGNYAAYLSNVNVKNYTNNSGSGNFIGAFGLSGNVNEDVIIGESVTGFPYVITGTLTVNDEYTLTIPEGEVIKFTGTGNFNIEGTLDVNGTVANPVVFTSFLDDTYGGDLNNDGTATSPAPGDWRGIYLYGYQYREGIGEFDYCRIRYGGNSSGAADANIYFNRSDSGYFTNSVSEYSSQDGVKIYQSSPIFRGNTFEDNTGYGINISGSPVPDLGQNNLANAGLNTFINNDGGNYQLYNASTLDVLAYYNDWGYYTEAEIDAHIYDDDENAAYGEVLFNPWYDPSNSPFIVNFGADTTSGNAPMTIQFYDSTLLSATSWQWDFENDGIIDATSQNPQWTYLWEGIYTVKLIASNGVETDSLIRTDYITVYEDISHALQFDGTDDYVNCGHDASLNLTTAMTIEAWINPAGWGELADYGWGRIVDKKRFKLFLNDDASGSYHEHSLVFIMHSGGSSFALNTPGNSINLNSWQHIAATYDGNGDVHIYINGIEQTLTGDPPLGNIDDNSPDDLFIGESFNQNRAFDGLMDEFRMWNIVRSLQEIQANMQNYLDGTENGLTGYWRMNEGSGQFAFDLSGNGNDGQLGSTPDADINDPTWIPTDWPYEVGFTLDLKVFLQGPFNGTEMNTTLNSNGYMPLSQPYNQPPWNYTGTEAVAAIPNADVVDWVLVELRDTTEASLATSQTIVAQQAAFLLKDGSVVGMDGTGNTCIASLTITNNLFVVLWHRNSIGIMSAFPLIENGGVYSYDFSTGAGQAYGGAQAHKEIGAGIWGMIGADGNADGQINNADKLDVWAVQAGSSGYFGGDFNLDSQVNNSDKIDIWIPNSGLGGQVPD